MGRFFEPHMTEISEPDVTKAEIAGVVLCGGVASRIGGEKALMPFMSGTLLDAVIARVAPQVSPLALNVATSEKERYRTRYPDYPLVFDSEPDRIGPLGGVIAGLEWARALGDVDWLATFPCDTPFLPHNLVAQLMAEADDVPMFAHDGHRQHGICAIWPLDCIERLRRGVEEGHLRSVQSAMKALGAKTCVFEAEADAFFNVNTREDLARAEELARASL
jgi:molybdopterin-guanine dinucleotide biosynthesis protein A